MAIDEKAFGSIKGLSTQPATMRQIIKAYEAAKVADQPVDCTLPERDKDLPAEQQGVFRKFDVRRVDGSDKEGGKHYGCEYFVLDVDHDQHAKSALAAYAESCRETHPELSKDMIYRYELNAPEREPQQPDDCRGTRRFYPEVRKVFNKWVKNACDNPFVLADSSFETFLAGWQAALKSRPEREIVDEALREAARAVVDAFTIDEKYFKPKPQTTATETAIERNEALVRLAAMITRIEGDKSNG